MRVFEMERIRRLDVSRFRITRFWLSGPRLRKWFGRAVLYVLLVLVVLQAGLPLLWVALTSIKPEPEVWRRPPRILPSRATLEGYKYIFKSTSIPRYALNSTLVAVPTTLLVTALGACGAYALARLSFPGSSWLGFLGIVTYMIPPILLAIPVIQIAAMLHLHGKLYGLMLVYTAQMMPFALWILRSYFAGLPPELEDAARVDGATRFQALYLVMLPQAVPGIICCALFTFHMAWGEYLFASLLVSTSKSATMSAGIAQLVGQAGQNTLWSVLMGGAVLMVLPVAGLFVLLQRYLVAGIGSGALKG